MGLGEDGTFSSGHTEVKVGHPGGCWNNMAGAQGDWPATELDVAKDTGCSQLLGGCRRGREREGLGSGSPGVLGISQFVWKKQAEAGREVGATRLGCVREGWSGPGQTVSPSRAGMPVGLSLLRACVWKALTQHDLNGWTDG